MKKSLAILVSLLMIAAMSHFVVAEHYCQGSLAASKISLSGETASCGMEGHKTSSGLAGTYFSSYCCDDVVHYYGIFAKYTPSFSCVPDSFRQLVQVFTAPAGLPVNSPTDKKVPYTSAGPPDELMSTSVDLPEICVFRI